MDCGSKNLNFLFKNGSQHIYKEGKSNGMKGWITGADKNARTSLAFQCAYEISTFANDIVYITKK